jgi:(S)-2-hydroxyglutarate dehydrogenase
MSLNKKITIIGAGIVGLATALKLLEFRKDFDIIVLDKESEISSHQTGHNSGVIHSGIYYKPGSLKAINCKHGYQLLLDFCQKYDIPHEITGKIIAATHEGEQSLLDNIFIRGQQNELTGIRKISTAEAQEIEPHVRCTAAVWVPQTGIIDYKKVAQQYRLLIEQYGGSVVTNAEVTSIVPQKGSSFSIESTQGVFHSDLVINCAGLYSDTIARMTVPEFSGQILPFRGEYYDLKPAATFLVKNLIYPVPNPNFPFLGVHFTRMANGGVEAGPNAVLAYAREGYHRSKINWSELSKTLAFPGFRKVAAKYWKDGMGEFYRSYSKAAFVHALQNLIPEIKSEHLEEGSAGVRAQLCLKDGTLVDDFLILQKPGVINVVNAPSPAATASLAVGEHIAKLALDQFLN